MNFYAFHIGDYAVHTRHLSLLEDLAYRRLLDLYYTREHALPADVSTVARLVGMRDNVAEVEAVLREFFVQEDGGDWVHMRCEAEITRMQDKQAKAKASAQASVSARSANAQRSQRRRSATSTKTKTKTTLSPVPPAGGFERFYEAYPRKVAPDKALKAFEKVAPDEATLAHILRAVEAQKASPEWLAESGRFIPYPATWLNGGHWKNGHAADGGESTAWHETKGGVERRAAELGIPPWSQTEAWAFYRSRVMAAAKEAA